MNLMGINAIDKVFVFLSKCSEVVRTVSDYKNDNILKTLNF